MKVDHVIEERVNTGIYEEKNKWTLYSSLVTTTKEEIFKKEQINLTNYLFHIKEKLMKGVEIREETVSWVRRNHSFYDTFWKKSEVEEIIEAEKLQEKVL